MTTSPVTGVSCDCGDGTGSHSAAGSGAPSGGPQPPRDPLPMAVCVLAVAAVFMIDLWCVRGIAVDVLYVIAVLLSLRDGRTGFTLCVTGVCCALAILGFPLSGPGMPRAESLANRALAIGAIAAVAALSLHRERLVRERERALREKFEALEQLKILQGLLPICAGCKRIRDPRGHWVVLETYIRTHSEAEFTHGMCEECIRRLYPEHAEVVIAKLHGEEGGP